ncbi:MAG: PH domain-containing protein [Candidatus Vogelbacteria bacterium]|nr:PH domain-containing protein [Candidatus Vogelbacteria bacterium]
MEILDLHLDPSEEIVTTIRKHWITPLAHGVVFLAALALPLLVYWLLPPELLAIIPIQNTVGGERLFAFFYALWATLLWVLFSIAWLDYYLDSWIITTKQVIDIEQVGLFHRDTATCLLTQIQDITAITSGVIPTLLGYGDVHIQTAASSKEFVIRGVPHPERIKNLIAAGHEQALNRLHRGNA